MSNESFTLINKTEICVIVPVYNAQSYLNRCVQSIQNQTFSNFQLLLIDDGSTDKSGEICDFLASNDKRIHVIHKENGGVASARNAGVTWAVRESNCPWICFCDSDDWLHERCLEYLHQACVSTGASVSACTFSSVETYTKPADMTFACKMISPEDIMCDYPEISAMSGGKLFKKDLFEGISYPEHLHIGEDSATTYKLLFQCKKVAYVGKPLYYYFNNPNSLTHAKPLISNVLNSISVLEEQVVFFEKNNYARALQFKKGILLASIARAIRLGKENPFRKEHKRRFHSYAKELSKEKKQSIWYYYNKYLGFWNCSVFGKIAVLFYRMTDRAKGQ